MMPQTDTSADTMTIEMETPSKPANGVETEVPRENPQSENRPAGRHSSARAKEDPVYLDHAATTPVDPRVLEAMLPHFGQRFGNPGSRVYGRGLDAETAVETARAPVASLIGSRPVEITFTSGATESNNLALAGLAAAWDYKGHIVVSATEHPSVLEVADHLVSRGFGRTLLPVDAEGRVDPEVLEQALEDISRERETPASRVVVSIMHANNETGTVNPVEEVGAVCRRRGVVYHCDASQSVGKIPVDVGAIGADLLSLSGHKFYGPMGVGALYVRRMKPRLELAPLVFGGGQERGRRSGTLNVPGIVGLGAAAAWAGDQLATDALELRRLTDLFVACLCERLAGISVNSAEQHRLPGIVNLSFEGVSAERLQQAIRTKVEISAGSACSTGKTGPSHVLVALGLPRERGAGAVRVAMGRFTTEDQVHRAMDVIVAAVKRLRDPRFTRALPGSR